MPEDTAERIRKLLEPADDEQRWYAELRTLDPAEAVPPLAAILHDEADTLPRRSRAALTLGELRDQRSISPLAAALDASDPVLRARVARALSRFEHLDESVVQRLIKGLADDDYFVRECCAGALGSLKCVQALLPLEKMRNTDSVSTNREVAQEAIKAIREIA